MANQSQLCQPSSGRRCVEKQKPGSLTGGQVNPHPQSRAHKKTKSRWMLFRCTNSVKKVSTNTLLLFTVATQCRLYSGITKHITEYRLSCHMQHVLRVLEPRSLTHFSREMTLKHCLWNQYYNSLAHASCSCIFCSCGLCYKTGVGDWIDSRDIDILKWERKTFQEQLHSLSQNNENLWVMRQSNYRPPIRIIWWKEAKISFPRIKFHFCILGSDQLVIHYKVQATWQGNPL